MDMANADSNSDTTTTANITNQDIDPAETQEWLAALEAVIEHEGPERAHFLLEQLIDKSRRSGTNLPYNASTAYLNTIPPHLCLLYTSPSPRDRQKSRMPSSA